MCMENRSIIVWCGSTPYTGQDVMDLGWIGLMHCDIRLDRLCSLSFFINLFYLSSARQPLLIPLATWSVATSHGSR